MLTTDLGWCMARCQFSDGEAELTIVSPASTEEGAQSLSLGDRESILNLAELIARALEEEREREAIIAAGVVEGGQ